MVKVDQELSNEKKLLIERVVSEACTIETIEKRIETFEQALESIPYKIPASPEYLEQMRKEWEAGKTRWETMMFTLELPKKGETRRLVKIRCDTDKISTSLLNQIKKINEEMELLECKV